jgi:GTP-binding protein LepA
VNEEPVDALSVIVHRDKAYERGREVVSKLREAIPRQQYEVAIQAAIGGRIIARETVKAVRRTSPPSVTAATLRGNASCWKNRKKVKKE